MIISELFETPQQCPECGGISFSDLILAEKKDACYYKVKASAKVWPSAYASGRLVQCRKKGAGNYGNKSEGVAEGYVPINIYKGPTNPAPKPKKVEPEHKYVDNRVEVEKHYQARANLFYNVVTKSDGKVINPEPIKGLRAAEEFRKQNGLGGGNADIKQVWPEEQELDEKWSQKYKSSINCANPKGFSQKAHCAGRKKNESMVENTVPQLSVPQLAAISDEALDNAYHYGRSTPGNTFGWQANLKSAAYAKQMIDQGVTDIEAISDAIHKGWNTTAQAFVQNPDQFDDTAKLAAAGKLEAKLQQRAQLMKQNYAQLPEEEKEKDRVVARALLQAIRGEQGVAEGQLELNTPDPVVVVQDLKGNILDKINLSVAAQKYKLGQPQNIKNQLAHQNYTKVGNYTIVSPMSGQPQDATTQGMAEGEQQKGADYRDPKEVDYDDEYDTMVARVKRLAGLGPMKTVYDPARRQYRNMPTAVQPKK